MFWLFCEIDFLLVGIVVKYYSLIIVKLLGFCCVFIDSKLCVMVYDNLCCGKFLVSLCVYIF